MSHSLNIEFTYDPRSRLLRARLPSGAEFLVDTANVSGKLGSNLTLFKQRATLEESSPPAPAGQSRPRYDEALVRQFTRSGGKQLDLEQLEIEP